MLVNAALPWSAIVKRNEPPTFLDESSVLAYMHYVFTLDIKNKQEIPVRFQTWEDVYHWTSIESMARRKQGKPENGEDASTIMLRMMQWVILHK